MRVLQLEEFQDAGTNPNREVISLMFISADGGPDDTPKNQQTLAVWESQFKNRNLHVTTVFTHAPGSSVYNPVERRIAPLSKNIAGITLPFDSFVSHLGVANKTLDINLEFKNFEAAGKILTEIWSVNH